MGVAQQWHWHSIRTSSQALQRRIPSQVRLCRVCDFDGAGSDLAHRWRGEESSSSVLLEGICRGDLGSGWGCWNMSVFQSNLPMVPNLFLPKLTSVIRFWKETTV